MRAQSDRNGIRREVITAKLNVLSGVRIGRDATETAYAVRLLHLNFKFCKCAFVEFNLIFFDKLFDLVVHIRITQCFVGVLFP